MLLKRVFFGDLELPDKPY